MLVIMAAVLALGGLVPIVRADESPLLDASSAAMASRIPSADPLNSGFLPINMHGMLFHPDLSDIDEDLAYARWLGGGVIRVFATDSNGLQHWDGSQVGQRIAEIAPMLRASHLRLIVAFVNNHQAVPGELDESAGWMDNYLQLLLPFYTDNWRGAYLQFVRDLVSTVQSNNAQDVVFAWELGNELHTPADPAALIPFVTVVGLELGNLLGGQVVTEQIFAWPGLGWLMIQSIGQRDYAVVQGVVLIIAVGFVLINLLVDVAYAYLDPRIRYV